MKLESKPEVYSFSKLSVYQQCSEKYKLTYIDKLRVYKLSKSTIIGELLHAALEVYLVDSKHKFIDIFEQTSKAIFLKSYIIKGNEEELDRLFKKLNIYSRDIKTLWKRASADYKGKYPIRTKSGGIPSNPSMTTEWKQAEVNLQLKERYQKLQESFDYISVEKEVDLVDAYTEAYILALNYVTPVEMRKTLHLEFPLSKYDYETQELINPVLMPDEYGGKEGIYLNGYIDWIGYVYFEGKERFAIIDYKSNKESINEDKLEYHGQLLAYVYAIEKLMGKEVEVIGVHSLRHKKLVLTRVNREILEIANKSVFSKHKLIAAEHFEKEHLPNSQYSSCLNSFSRECEYLQYCYPKMFNKLHPNSVSNKIESLL